MRPDDGSHEPSANLSKLVKFALYPLANNNFTLSKVKANEFNKRQLAGESADAKVFMFSVSKEDLQRKIDLKASSWDPSWGG